MKYQHQLQIALVIVSLILFGLSGWTVYAQQPGNTPLPETDATSTPSPMNNSAGEEGTSEPGMQDMNMDNADSEPSMQDMNMEDTDLMQTMVRHCEMMAMMMQMMMDSDGSEQDMQGMMGGSDSMGESADGDGDIDPEQDMQGMMDTFKMMNMMMGDADMMNMMMQMMMIGDSDMMNMMMDGSTPDEDGSSGTGMQGMDEGNE